MNPLRFTVWSTPVEIQLSFWIVGLLLGWQGDTLTAVAWVAVLLVSILLHELGHAIAFRRYGHEPRIVLYALGGLTHGSRAPLSPLQRVAVALAGPAAGFCSGLVVLALTQLVPLSGLLAEVASMWLWVNLGWGLLNLLPIHPLDGSQALSGLLDWMGFSGRLGALWVSVPISLLICGLAVWGSAYWIAMLTGWALYNAVTAIRAHRQHAADEALWPQVQALHEELQAGAPLAAVTARGRALREEARSVSLQHNIDLILAVTALRAGEPTSAADLLDEMHHTAPFPAELAAATARALHHAGAFERSASVSEQLFRETGEAEHAYNVACSLSRSGDEDGAVHWLQEAAASGWSATGDLDTDPDLAPIRALPAWAELRRLLVAQSSA